MTEIELLKKTVQELIEQDTLNMPHQRVTGSKIFLNGRISALKEVLNLLETVLKDKENYIDWESL